MNGAAEPLEPADGLTDEERARLKAEKKAAKKEKKVTYTRLAEHAHMLHALLRGIACLSLVPHASPPLFWKQCRSTTRTCKRLSSRECVMVRCFTCLQEKKRLKKEKKASVKVEDGGDGPGTVRGGEASGSDDSDADARKRAVEADLRQAALRSVGKDE